MIVGWIIAWVLCVAISVPLIPILVKSMPQTPTESEIRAAYWLCLFGPPALLLIILAIIHCHLRKRFSKLAAKLREEIEKAKAP